MTPINVNPIAGVSQLAERTAQGARSGVPSDTSAIPPPAVVEDQASLVPSGRGGQVPDLEALTEATARLQRAADFQNKALQFNLEAPNGSIQILVVDRETDEVIREIPPTEVLEVAERIQETLGLVFDTQA